MTDEVKFNMARAREDLESAQLLADRGHFNACANRAYYSAFHAVTALLRTRGQDFSKHSAVEAAVHRDLVRTGIFDEEFGKSFSALRESREVADYGSARVVDGAEARLSVERAQRILADVLRVISRG